MAFKEVLILILSTLFLAPRGQGAGLCDNGMIYEEGEICCGGGVYDVDDKICCNDTPVDKYAESLDGTHQGGRMCCGSKVVDEENYICCDGDLIALNETGVQTKMDIKCCGKKYITTGEQKICCGKRVITYDSQIGCCNGKLYDTGIDKCECNTIMNKSKKCCGNEIYDPLSSSCCEGKLHTKVLGIRCCGQELMDPQTEKCCQKYAYGFTSHKIPKDKHLLCCGEGYYNSRTEDCINNTRIELGEHGKKCGSFLMDTRIEKCCANKIVYKKESQQCCEGAYNNIISKGDKCCNGYPLRDKEVCCDEKKPCLKDNEDDDACCFDMLRDEGKTYNSKDNVACREGKLVKGEKSGSVRCGPTQFYSPSRQLCCGDGRVFDKKDGYIGCCKGSNKAFKRGEQCCKVHSSNKKSERGLILNQFVVCQKIKCGSRRINPVTKTCCGIIPLKRSSRTKRCCSDREPFDRRYSICTSNGKVKSIKPISNVCKARLFDGALKESCVRKYGIIGKVTRVETKYEKSQTVITFYLRYVKTLSRQNGIRPAEVPNSLVISIQTTVRRRRSCLKIYRKKNETFMMFFDDHIKGRNVRIAKDSHFFVTKYTRLRHRYVAKEITKDFCAHYTQFS